jgi:DNA-directed RNA polymerase subunit RPC12/RpoP
MRLFCPVANRCFLSSSEEIYSPYLLPEQLLILDNMCGSADKEFNIVYYQLDAVRMPEGKCAECGAKVTKTAAKGLTKAGKEALKAGKYVCTSCRH